MNVRNPNLIFLVGAGCGALVLWLLMRSPSVSSPRMEQLVRDSAEYANKVRVRDSLYMDLWIEYTYKDDSLSSALDDLDRARRTRPPSDYRDADSLHRAIRKEVGLEPR